MTGPLPIVDVTAKCITVLKAVPAARAEEGFRVAADLPKDFLVPQESDRVFSKLYVREGLIDAKGKLDITAIDLFANYRAYMFEVTVGGRTGLLMAAFSNDLGIPPVTATLPFLVYVPPSPQDTPAAHRAANRPRYDKTRDADVPTFFGDSRGYPYAWDWLQFQHHLNAHRLGHQLKYARRPYVVVVPMLRSFADGLGVLSTPEAMEGLLLALQKWHLDRTLGAERGISGPLRNVVLAGFSIGNSILATFLERSRSSPFFRDSVSDLVVLDPPPGNPRNRSPIVDTALSVLRADRNKRLLLYAQDRYYVDKVVAAITAAGGTFNPATQRVFADPRLAHLFVAFLDKAMFGQHVIDPVLKDVHNTFPNLFFADAARRATLTFRDVNGQLVPQQSFLDWAPTR